jgi:glyoxylase-like metal-dependent hydrolase (beta-lactamase superfamily II)/Tol biopolymer transport system component
MVLAAFTVFAWGQAGDTIDPDIRVVRLDDRAAVLHVGGASITNTFVLASARGLVIIDTGLLPSRAPALRAAAERVFGRSDIACVINTHAHFDHISGNQAYPGIPIVAHANAIPEMRRSYGSPAAIAAFVRNRVSWRTREENRLQSLPADSPERARIRAALAHDAIMTDDFRQGRFQLILPTITFSDRLTLDLGDLTLKLIYYGRAHTESDILVHVPELRLLLVGDLFDSGWLPDFGGPTADPPAGFRALDALPSGDAAVRTVVGGHSEAMSGDAFRAQAAYLRDIWDGVAAARRDGATLAETRTRVPFESRYPALAGLIRSWQGQDLHAANIDAAWRLQSESAARTLESLIEARGLEAALAEFRSGIAGNDRYFLDENEMNALGYRYLQGGRTAEATAVFELNAAAFPDSWNVWDSLAEACYFSGDPDKAEQYYSRSVELNPGNQNGQNSLSRIRGQKLDAAGETSAAPRFQPGAATGLRGSYLGQTPPGADPVVFAPGIVSSSGNYEFAITFTPDGRELYFTRRAEGGGNVLMAARLEPDGWTAPEPAPFTGGFPAGEPHVTPDGRRLYFGCLRPPPGADRPEWAIWYTERAPDGGWGEARYHGPGMYVTAARGGNLYLTDVSRTAGGGVMVCPWTGSGYGPPQKLGGGVNSPRNAAHAFIAPDESYILFDSYHRPDGQGGEGDLYVCFRQADGAWGRAYNLGDAINTPATTFCPMVTPDGRYIFFSTCRDIRWVSADLLTELKNRALAPAAPGRPLNCLVLLGEWFGDTYFPLRDEIARRGWTMRRVGVDAEYRGCYQKARDVVLTSDILIPDLKDLSGYDCLIIPSGPQFRKFNENPAVLQFVRDAHAAGVLVASFCTGNWVVQAAGLLEGADGAAISPAVVTRVRPGIVLGPRGGGPPPGDGFRSAPVQEICDAIARELGPGDRVAASYLGEPPPGRTPRLFAPERLGPDVSLGCSGWLTGMEAFLYQTWVDRKPHLFLISQQGGSWGEPEPLAFADAYEIGDFTIAPDGRTVIFESSRLSVSGNSVTKAGDLWTITRSDTGWTEPRPLGPPINTAYHESYPCLAANGNLYFFSRKPGGFGESDLYVSVRADGKYQEPVNLGPRFNTAQHEWDPFVAPDESCLVFCSMKPGGLGEDDLYVSFRRADGAWGDPVHLGGAINSEKSENRPYISPDGKYLFYTSTRNGHRQIFWVDAAILESLRPAPEGK